MKKKLSMLFCICLLISSCGQNNNFKKLKKDIESFGILQDSENTNTQYGTEKFTLSITTNSEDIIFKSEIYDSGKMSTLYDYRFTYTVRINWDGKEKDGGNAGIIYSIYKNINGSSFSDTVWLNSTLVNDYINNGSVSVPVGPKLDSEEAKQAEKNIVRTLSSANSLFIEKFGYGLK